VNDTPRGTARSAGLSYVSDMDPAIRRGKACRGFIYRNATGPVIRDAGAHKRIRSLAIPPAWTDVWICSSSAWHIQAAGRDDRGCRQCTYQPQWREVCGRAKYKHMLESARLLPTLCARVSADLAKAGAPREKVLASVVSSLEKKLVRVSDDQYAWTDDSYGLTTLHTRHLDAARSELRFQLKGKSGKTWRLEVRDSRQRVTRAAQWRLSPRTLATPSVCRNCYVHPEIVACYTEGVLPVAHAKGNGSSQRPAGSGLPIEERAVLNILRRRLRTVSARKQGLASCSRVHAVTPVLLPPGRTASRARGSLFNAACFPARTSRRLRYRRWRR